MKRMSWEDVLVECAKQDYPCAVCKTPTRKFELNFECPMCSVECAVAMWKEYCEATKE